MSMFFSILISLSGQLHPQCGPNLQGHFTKVGIKCDADKSLQGGWAIFLPVYRQRALVKCDMVCYL